MEYIRIPTKLFSLPEWRSGLSYETKIFFFELISMATYQSCEISFMGEKFQLKSGQLITTQRYLARVLKTTDTKVRRHLDKLHLFGLIKVEVTQNSRSGVTQRYKKRRTLVTICNRHLYTGSLAPEEGEDLLKSWIWIWRRGAFFLCFCLNFDLWV